MLRTFALSLVALFMLAMPPAKAQEFQCTLSAAVSVTAGATTEIIPLVAGKVNRVCAFVITQATAGTAKFVRGTGSNCGTGTADITAAMAIATNGSISANVGNGSLFSAPAGQAICLTAVTGNVTGFVNYARF